MPRLDQQTENYLVERLGYLRTAVDGIRTDQTFGSSNVRIYQIGKSTLASDITLTGVTTTTPRCVEVTVTPNTAASNPVIVYDWSASFSMTGNAYRSVMPQVPVNGVQKFRWYFTSADVTKDISIGFTYWTISDATYSVQEVAP